jgi:hypothetical protein
MDLDLLVEEEEEDSFCVVGPSSLHMCRWACKKNQRQVTLNMSTSAWQQLRLCNG